MEEEIVSYIKSARGHGLSDMEIKQNLLNAGWDAEVVEDNFSHVRALEDQGSAPVRPMAAQVQLHTNQPIRPSEVLTPGMKNVSSPVSGLSETSFSTDGSPRPFYKKPLVWILVVVLLAALGGAGFWYMAYGFSTPQGIWKKFRTLTKSKVYTSKFTFSYLDKGEFTSKEFEGFSLKDLKVAFDGKTYLDIRDAKNPQSSAEVQYTLGSGNTNMSTGLKYAILNRVLYLNVGENPFLDNAFKSLSGGKKVEWLKLDLNALEAQMNQGGSNSDQALVDKIFTNQVKDDISKIWEDATLVKIDKYVGREKIDGVNTVHFINTLDKQAIKDALNSTLDKIVASGNSTAQSDSEKLPDKDVALAKMAISGLVDKLEIKDFETWIGVRDFRLYKVKFESNAPSVISAANVVVNEALSSAKEKSRDAKRLADIRQMASALELYYNDMNGYPPSKNGLPEGITPTYIGMVPTAPTPPDGKCTDYYNSYWYEPKGEKKVTNGKIGYSDYELTFCLGYAVGGYEPGIAKLTSAGIQANIPCPTTEDKCVSSNVVAEEQPKTEEQQVQDFVDKLGFSAEIKIETTYSGYDKPQNIEVPEDSLDVLEAIKNYGTGAVQGLFIKASEPQPSK